MSGLALAALTAYLEGEGPPLGKAAPPLGLFGLREGTTRAAAQQKTKADMRVPRIDIESDKSRALAETLRLNTVASLGGCDMDLKSAALHSRPTAADCPVSPLLVSSGMSMAFAGYTNQNRMITLILILLVLILIMMWHCGVPRLAQTTIQRGSERKLQETRASTHLFARSKKRMKLDDGLQLQPEG